MQEIKKSICKKLPAVFLDVDGVLRKGNFVIEGARESIIKLRELNIPLSIITNGGGEPESHRANTLNKILRLDSKNIELRSNEIFLCHSPMKPVIEKMREKTILITGTGNTLAVMKEYNHEKFLTVEEYVSLFPHIFCHFFVEELSEEYRRNARRTVEERFKSEFREFPKIDAIFMLTDVVRWEMNIQLFSDILISTNGIPGTIRNNQEEQIVDFHLSSQDLVYKDNFNIPRIAAGGFWFSLEHLFERKYKRKINHFLYGKPSKIIFDYAREQISRRLDNTEITNYYMIGDNPPIDIKGANESGIESVLVRTGVFQGNENDIENPAKYVVNNVFDAVNLIVHKEHLRH